MSAPPFFHLLEGKSKQKADMTIWSQYWNCKKIESEAPCLSSLWRNTFFSLGSKVNTLIKVNSA